MSENSRSILIVDDEPDILAGLRRILRLDGYNVESAETLKELLARTNWSKFFAVILDRRLPDGTADEVLPQLGKLAPHASVIILTGYADLDGALIALRHGAADYLIKPVNPDALRASLARIAHRNESQEHLRASEERFRLLVDGVNDYAIFMLDTSGNVISWNEGARRIKGYTESEIIGKHFSCFYTPQDLQDDKPANELRIATEEGRFEEEGWRVRKDGSRFFANVVVTPMRDERGRACGFAKVTRDITERMQAQKRLLLSERLSAVGEAMAGLMHESRNALNVTQSALRMVERRTKGDAEIKAIVDGARDAQNTIQRLFDEVREFAAPVVINHQWCNLAELLENTWRSLDASNSKQAGNLNQRCCDPPPECDACHIKLGQVFRNVLENSIAACEDSVEIDVQYTRSEIGGEPALCIAVSDNGPGLTAEQRENVFEPFYTTKTHGTGLGMAISKRIVEAHGGAIAVGNENSLGAQFVITLPIKKS